MLGIGEIKKLCTPAMVYFIISIATLIYLIFTNMGNKTTLCVGEFDCPVDNIYVIYIIKLVYLLFVTIVLDSLCKNGYTSISWFLLFLPLLFFFAMLGLFMLSKQTTVIVFADEKSM